MTDVEKGKVNISLGEMEYAVFGSGKKPFIIIPGLSIKSVLLTAGAVSKAYSVFSKDYRVYLFDRRNDLKKGCTVLDMARDIAEAMENLGIKNAFALGTSQGGMILQKLMINYPTLISKAVIASSASEINENAKKLIEYWISLAEKGDAKTLCEDFVNKLYSPEFAKKYGRIIVAMNGDATKEELERFIILSSACEGFNVYNELDKVKCKTLVLGAENDEVLGGNESKKISEKLGCECFMYPKPYGHAVYDEAPDYKERILEFFEATE